MRRRKQDELSLVEVAAKEQVDSELQGVATAKAGAAASGKNCSASFGKAMG